MLLVGKECPHTKEKSSGKQNKVSTSHPILSSWGWVLGVGGWWKVGSWWKLVSWTETSWVSWSAEEEAGGSSFPEPCQGWEESS